MPIGGLSTELLIAGVIAGIIALLALDKLQHFPLFVIGGLLITEGVVPILQGTAGSVAAGGIARGMTTSGQILLGQIGTALGFLVLATGLLRPRLPVAAGSLLAAAIAFPVATHIAGLVTTGNLSLVSLVKWVAIIAAVASAPSLRPIRVSTLCKVLLGITLAASLAAGVAGMNWAWRPFEGATPIVPGISLRLQGIFAHPNSLAPAALTFLVMERVAPTSGRMRFLGLATALSCLLLSQSKTALVTAVVVWALFFYHDRYRTRAEELRLVPLALTVALMIAAFAIVVATDGAEQTLVDPDQVDRVRTFTGRTDVWAEGFAAWRENMVWGAGPDWFAEFAQRTNQEWAAQAHNQFIQTGTEFGIVGLAGLTAYVLALGVWAWRLRDQSQFASLALITILFLRAITETPVDELNLLHLLTLGLLFGWARQERLPHEERIVRRVVPLRSTSGLP